MVTARGIIEACMRTTEGSIVEATFSKACESSFMELVHGAFFASALESRFVASAAVPRAKTATPPSAMGARGRDFR